MSGYSASSVVDSKGLLPAQPQTITINTGGTMLSGRMEAECEKIDGAIAYGCIVSVGGPLPADFALNLQGQLNEPIGGLYPIIHDVTLQRKKSFWNLIKGTDYYFYFYVINSTGVGPLSKEEKRMCN